MFMQRQKSTSNHPMKGQKVEMAPLVGLAIRRAFRMLILSNLSN